MIANKIGPADAGVYVTGGLQTNELYKKVDPNNPAVTKGIRGTAASSAPKNGAAFFPKAFADFAPGTDTIYSAHAYDCAVTIALAAIKAKSDDPTKIRDAMIGITKDGEKCNTVKDCVALLKD